VAPSSCGRGRSRRSPRPARPQSYHPLPWRALTYDTGKGGYVVDLDQDRLRGAPSYTGSEAPDWRDPAYGRRLDDYWGTVSG
jgi:hypothetical protein